MLPVGDSARLEIIFDTKTYKSKVSKRPKIQTNEGPPDKRVTITATITPRPDSTYPIRIVPYKVDMSQFSDKIIDDAEFSITNVSEEALDISMISFAKTHFSVDLPDKIKPGETVSGKITIHKDYLAKSFNKSFTIELSDKQASRFTVPVKRTIRSPGNQDKVKTVKKGH